jgi:hypothetical protein
MTLVRKYGEPWRPKPAGRQRLTVDNTVGGVGLTLAVPMKYCNMRLETAQIRFTLDGSTAPTTTVGRLLEVGEILELESVEEMQAFAAIRTGATSGVLDIEYSLEGGDTEEVS